MREDKKLNGSKRRVTRKERKRLREEFEVGGFMSRKGLWNIAKKKKRMLEDRGALPREDGDLLAECHAIHEANFLSSWLRGDVEGKEEERERLNKEAKEEGRTNGKREIEGDRERVEIQRICLDDVSSKAFEALCPNSEGGEFWGFFGVLLCVCAF